jgi:hypothetical protein
MNMFSVKCLVNEHVMTNFLGVYPNAESISFDLNHDYIVSLCSDAWDMLGLFHVIFPLKVVGLFERLAVSEINCPAVVDKPLK